MENFSMTSMGSYRQSMYNSTMMTERPSYVNKKIPTFRKASDSIFFQNKKKSRQAISTVLSRNLSKGSSSQHRNQLSFQYLPENIEIKASQSKERLEITCNNDRLEKRERIIAKNKSITRILPSLKMHKQRKMERNRQQAMSESRNFSDDFDPRIAVRDSSMKKLTTAVLITEEPSPVKTGRLSVANIQNSPSPLPVPR